MRIWFFDFRALVCTVLYGRARGRRRAAIAATAGAGRVRAVVRGAAKRADCLRFTLVADLLRICLARVVLG